METQGSNTLGSSGVVQPSRKVSKRIIGVASGIRSKQPLTNLTMIFRWSFGGNRLQMKAEDKILQDIELIIGTLPWKEISGSTSRRSLQAKQELVLILIANERSRLKVWLSPLDQERKHYFSSGSGNKTITEVCDASSMTTEDYLLLITYLGSCF